MGLKDELQTPLAQVFFFQVKAFDTDAANRVFESMDVPEGTSGSSTVTRWGVLAGLVTVGLVLWVSRRWREGGSGREGSSNGAVYQHVVSIPSALDEGEVLGTPVAVNAQ